jgi:ubiquinone/menaquinone biosynthesis C-methylase UbiE
VRLWYRFVKFAFHHFYNEFAWTYDLVSRVVSRGNWHRWQRTALPELQGPRVLDVAFGTGNLLWDMSESGYQCVGIDLSPYMVALTAKKFRRRGGTAPICRARVQSLPFPDSSFESLVATFPDYFILDPVAQEEMARVLVPAGRLVVVEGGRILRNDLWSRFLNWAFRITVSPRSGQEVEKLFQNPLFSLERREVLDGKSAVGILVAVKRRRRTVNGKSSPQRPRGVLWDEPKRRVKEDGPG